MTYDINGQKYPVLEMVDADPYGVLPLVDIPMMSDERWQEIAHEQQKDPRYWETLADARFVTAEQVKAWRSIYEQETLI